MTERDGKRLGRGLAALIGEMDKPAPQAVAAATSEDEAKALVADRAVDIASIMPNPANPRRSFDAGDLKDLAASIREHGIVQPILVRPASDGSDGYEIIAGERRWRAAQLAALDTVPIIVRKVDDRVALELAIVENVQRSDLNPVEEALGYQQLIDDHSYSQSDLGQVIGKSRSHVANTLRLLNLPSDIRTMVAEGQLTSGHARALVPLSDPTALAKKIVNEGLSVRETERLAAKALSGTDDRPDTHPASLVSMPDKADGDALAKRLGDHLGLKVDVAHRANGKGRLVLHYTNLEQLDALQRRLEGLPTS